MLIEFRNWIFVTANLILFCIVGAPAYAQSSNNDAFPSGFIQITPPMDINYSSRGDSRFSAQPMEIRIEGSIGMFGSRRNATPPPPPPSTRFSTGLPPPPALLRIHEGVDLLTRDVHEGTKSAENIFSVTNGVVIVARQPTLDSSGIRTGDDGTVAIQHLPLATGVFSRYLHLGSVDVRVGQSVRSGQKIGTVQKFIGTLPTHLHFELRRVINTPLNAVTGFTIPNPPNSLRAVSTAIDPTRQLYDWEIKRFKNDAEARQGNVTGPARIAHIEEIVRGRLLRLFKVRLENQDFFIPMYEPTEAEKSMVQTLRAAAISKTKVRIVSRDSLFFGGRKMIVEIRVVPSTR